MSTAEFAIAAERAAIAAAEWIDCLVKGTHRRAADMKFLLRSGLIADHIAAGHWDIGKCRVDEARSNYWAADIAADEAELEYESRLEPLKELGIDPHLDPAEDLEEPDPELLAWLKGDGAEMLADFAQEMKEEFGWIESLGESFEDDPDFVDLETLRDRARVVRSTAEVARGIAFDAKLAWDTAQRASDLAGDAQRTALVALQELERVEEAAEQASLTAWSAVSTAHRAAISSLGALRISEETETLEQHSSGPDA